MSPCFFNSFSDFLLQKEFPFPSKNIFVSDTKLQKVQINEEEKV